MNKPVALKCIVKGCENHKNEGGFEDGMCLPCYLFITTGEGIYSQAYRNTHPVKEQEPDLYSEDGFPLWTSLQFKELTDGEIEKVFFEIHGIEPAPSNVFDFARAILRKAQEK